MKILVVHGAGMNMRGKAQVEIFGPMTLPEYDSKIRAYADELGVEIEIFHSNIEGEVINRLYAAHDEGIAGAIINPAGYSRGYPALVAAIGNVGFPTIEVHISNPARRGNVSEVTQHLSRQRYRLRHRGLRARLARPQGPGQGPLLGSLRQRRARSADAGLAHVAAVAIGVIAASGMEEAAVVPEDDVARLPGVDVDVFRQGDRGPAARPCHPNGGDVMY